MNLLSVLTANERIRQWKSLSNFVKALPHHYGEEDNMGGRGHEEVDAKKKSKVEDVGRNGHGNGKGDDPFDCSELTIPPTFRLVQNELSKHVKEWEELDSRIVNATVNETDEIKDELYEMKNKTGNETFNNTTDGSDNDNIDTGVENENPHSDANTDATSSTTAVTNNINGNSNDTLQEEQERQEPTIGVAIGTGDYGGLNWGWHANRIRLPDYFDYACKRTEPPLSPPPPPPNENENAKNTLKRKRPQQPRRKVISLDDPTQFLDYEGELWKLFSAVPLASDLEEQLLQNNICRETFRVQREIERGMKEYTRMDAHSLNRMRKRERHHWPRVALVQGNETTTKSSTTMRKKIGHGDGIHEQGLENGLGDICGATIRVECWRRSLKRGSGCDSNKCEVELTESQTLLDLHNVLVECSRDELFTCGMKRQRHEQVAAETARRANGDEIDTGIGTDTTVTSTNNDDKDVHDGINASGYFFIEDTFYTNGDVDYVSPIIEWLNEEVSTNKNSVTYSTTNPDDDETLDGAKDGVIDCATNNPIHGVTDGVKDNSGATDSAKDGASDRANTCVTTGAKDVAIDRAIDGDKGTHCSMDGAKNGTSQGAMKIKTKRRKYTKKFPTKCRREFLGISRDADLKVMSMSDVQLGDIKFRLACRYVHVFNGDCESAILFSDVSMRLSNENIPESQYPLVHDIFTTTSTCTVQEQAACQACERGSAVVMTLEDELADGGPTLLCSICFAKLHYNVEGTELLYNNFQVVPLSVLQNLRDLSVGNDLTGTLF